MESSKSYLFAEEVVNLARLIFLMMRKQDAHGPSFPATNSHNFQALFVLHNCEPHLTMSELAEKLLISKQQLSKLVNSLEEKGLVCRELNEENRRQVYVRITEAGHTELEQRLVEIRQYISHEAALFDEGDIRELYHCLLGIRQILQKRFQITNKELMLSQEDA